MRLEIGSKIKALRLASELTQSELAARSRLTKGFISQLERDQTSISLDSLIDILDALGVNISEFFGDVVTSPVVYAQKDRVTVSEKGVSGFDILVPGSTNNLMDPIMISLNPGESMDEELPHTGEEFGYILNGTLTIRLGKKSYKASSRRCFYFKADRDHQFENTGKAKVTFLWVTSPPQM